MKRFMLLVICISINLIAQDANATLKVGNFVETENGVTFDILMTNTEPVGGFQFNLLTGNGTFDGASNCVCTSATSDMGQLPEGCNECYYDYGVDKIRTAYEEATRTSHSEDYGFGCETLGDCSQPIPNETNPNEDTCESSGSCSNNSGSCGICSNVLIETQYQCESSGYDWDSASYVDFTTEEECLASEPIVGEAGFWDADYTFDNPTNPDDTECDEVGVCVGAAVNNVPTEDNDCACHWNEGAWDDDENFYWVSDDIYIPYKTPL